MTSDMSVKQLLDLYNHIELSEEETDSAILLAKIKKDEFLKDQIKKQKEAHNRQNLQRKITSKATESMMAYRSVTFFEKELLLDSSNTHVFKMLCHYFSEEKSEFEGIALSPQNQNPSIDKGILLLGNPGVGKTFLMKLFSKNTRQVFHVYNAQHMANMYEHEGEISMQQFESKIKNPVNDANSFFQPYAGHCFDDLGTEDIKTHFGNKKNVIGDLIESRYAKGETGVFLHASTNLTAEQLKEYYGPRVTSRMREIFNLIVLPGNDRRK